MRSIAFGVIAATLAFWHTNPAPQAVIDVTGRVVTMTGNDPRPVRRAKVTASASSGATRMTQTDADGVPL